MALFHLEILLNLELPAPISVLSLVDDLHASLAANIERQGLT